MKNTAFGRVHFQIIKCIEVKFLKYHNFLPEPHSAVHILLGYITFKYIINFLFSERTENILYTPSIATSASHATPSVEATSHLQLPLVTSLRVMELSTDIAVGFGHTAASIHANKQSVHGDSSHEQGIKRKWFFGSPFNS